MTEGATASEGRRPKASKGGNRENGRWVGAAIAPRGYGDLTEADREAGCGQDDRLRRLRRLGGRLDPDWRGTAGSMGGNWRPRCRGDAVFCRAPPWPVENLRRR